MKGFNLYFKLLLYDVLFWIFYILFGRKLNIPAKILLLLKGLIKKLLVLQKFNYFIRFDADLIKTKLFLYL